MAAVNKVRPATDEDFRGFFFAEPPPIWLGQVYEQDGDVVAFGTVVWEEWGNAVGFYHCRLSISRFTMNRTARKVITALKAVGEPALYAVPDDGIADAKKWLSHLGFLPTRYTAPDGSEVWRLELGYAASDP